MPSPPNSLLTKIAGWKTGRTEWIVLAVWLMENSIFLLQHGVVTGGEAGKYIEQAHLLLRDGHPESDNFWLYSLQIMLISLCLKWGAALGFVVFVQLAVNLVVTFYFYETILRLAASKAVALAATLLLLFNLPYQEFNVYLQTESLFQSLTLLLSCYLLRLEKVTPATIGLIFFLLAVICFTRPNGILYLPSVFVFIYLTVYKNLNAFAKIGLPLVLPGGFLFLLNTAMTSGGELNFMLPFREEHVICGVSTLTVSKNIVTSGGSENSIYALLYFITHNTNQFFRLAVLKSVAFWGLCRTYFSFSHNLYLGIFFYPLYGVAIAGLLAWRKKSLPIMIYCGSLILLSWFTVILTCDDWHNRVFLGIAPYLIISATPVLKKVLP